MRRIGGWLILGLLVIMLAGGVLAWSWWPPQSEKDELILYGNIDIRQVELAINASERIANLLVEEGDRVTKGQLLAKLDQERFILAVDRAEAQVATQAQVLARLEAGTRPEEIRKIKADLQAGEATALDAEIRYRRTSDLAAKQAASQQDLDDTRANFQTSKARVSALKANLDLAIAGPRKEDIAEAKALLGRYKVELAQARHDLQDASLFAPSDGIIENRQLEVGDMASPQKPVFTMALINPVWVRAYVSEPDLGKIFHGMKASVISDSFPSKKYSGWVGFISPTAEFTPKAVETTEVRTKLVYQVRVFVDNPNNELRLGMPVTVRLPLHQDSAEPRQKKSKS